MSADQQLKILITLARVKYLEGSKIKQEKTVDVQRLNKTFTSYQFNKKIKYVVDNQFKVQLLHLAQTEEEVQEKLKTKSHHVPIKQLTTESESELISSKPQQNKRKSRLDNNGRSSREDKDSFFATLLNMKKERISSKATSGKMVKKTSSLSAEKENENNDTVKQNDNLSDLRALDQDILENPTKNIIENKRKVDDVYSDVEETNQLQTQAIIETQETSPVKKNNISKVPLSNLPAKSVDKTNNSEMSSTHAQPKITYDDFVNSKNMLEKVKEVDKLTKDLKRCKENYDKLKKEKEKLDKKYSCLKNEYNELLEERNTLRKLNYELQTIVIEAAEEQKIIQTQLQNAENVPVANADNLPVGRKRRNGDIHLGLGIFIEESSLNNILCSSFTPSQFVGNLILAKFSEPVLIKSTLTGRPSNKSVGKMKKINENDLDDADKVDDGGQTKEKKVTAPNKLDPTVLGACKLYYSFWLQTYYKDMMNEKDKKKFDHSTELKMFNSYVSIKISDLKKPKEKPKKKGTKEKREDNVSEMSENGEEYDQQMNRVDSIMFVPTGEPENSESDVNSSELESEAEDGDGGIDPLQ